MERCGLHKQMEAEQLKGFAVKVSMRAILCFMVAWCCATRGLSQWAIVNVKALELDKQSREAMKPKDRGKQSGAASEDFFLSITLRNESSGTLYVRGIRPDWYMVEAFVKNPKGSAWERQNTEVDQKLEMLPVKSGAEIITGRRVSGDQIGRAMLLTFRMAYSELDERGAEILVGEFQIPGPPKSESSSAANRNHPIHESKSQTSSAAGDLIRDPVRAIRSVLPKGWTVSVVTNRIIVQRDNPVRWERVHPNEPGRGVGDPPPKPDLSEGVYRLTLKCGPKMTMETYERLAAENAATEKERERLERGLRDISHKFDQYIPATPEEQKRLAAYREAVANLPRHELPDLYGEDISIWLLVSNDGWSYVYDKDVGAECNGIFETVLRFFGMYDPRAAADPHNLGRPE